jgi:cell division protein FtsN
VANQDAELHASLAQIQRESQSRIDSIIRYYEAELQGGKARPASTGTYYLIVGSFKTPVYATNFSAKVAGLGYKTQILSMGYWNLVSAESHTNIRTALNGLEAIRENVSYDAWIYVP